MRSSKSRSRSKANRPRTLGNIVNRVFDSSGPDGKVRGTPAQIIEKYQFLARDAQLSNDRVGAENFLQHAEHYTRMLAEAMREMQAEQDARQQYSPPVQGGSAHSGNPGSYSGGNQNNNSDGNQNGNSGGYSGGNQSGNRNTNQNNNQSGNRDGNRDSNQGGQRENRYEPRRDDRYDRSADAPSGLGPVIGADDDEGGPVATPEAAIAEPRFDRSRSDAPRQDRNDAPRQDRSDAPRQDRSDAPRQDRNDAPRQERNDAPRQEREPRLVPAAAQLAASQSAPQASEPAVSEGNPPRRAPRPYPPRARVAAEDQPVLPSFITGAPEPASAPTEAADKPKAAPRPRKPAAPKVAAEAVAAGEPKSGE